MSDNKFTFREDIPIAKNSIKFGLSKREQHELSKLEREDELDIIRYGMRGGKND